MQTLRLMQVVAMVREAVRVNPRARIGLIVSTSEAARFTGLALTESLVPDGVVWRSAHRELRWSSGAVLQCLSIRMPDRLRGCRFGWLLQSPAAAAAADDYARSLVEHLVPRGGPVTLFEEVATRGELEDFIHEATGAADSR